MLNYWQKVGCTIETTFIFMRAPFFASKKIRVFFTVGCLATLVEGARELQSSVTQLIFVVLRFRRAVKSKRSSCALDCNEPWP